MPWFSKKNQEKSFKFVGAVGAAVGLFVGFSAGGLGGAILFTILFAVVGAVIIGGIGAILFDEHEMTEIGAGCLLIGLPILLLAAIATLWNVGK